VPHIGGHKVVGIVNNIAAKESHKYGECSLDPPCDTAGIIPECLRGPAAASDTLWDGRFWEAGRLFLREYFPTRRQLLLPMRISAGEAIVYCLEDTGSVGMCRSWARHIEMVDGIEGLRDPIVKSRPADARLMYLSVFRAAL